MNIAVCDDNHIACEYLKKIIEKVIIEKSYDASVSICSSGEELLSMDKNIDIAFIEVILPGIDGFETARKMHLKNKDCRIIIATAASDMWKEGFKVNAVRYITKPFEEQEIREALLYTLELFKSCAFIEVTYNRKCYHIEQRKIDYIMAYNGETEVYVNGTAYRSKLSLKPFLQKLDEKLFVQVSRQHVINIEKVNGYRAGKILIGKMEFSVSSRRIKNFEQKYMNYNIKNS